MPIIRKPMFPLAPIEIIWARLGNRRDSCYGHGGTAV